MPVPLPQGMTKEQFQDPYGSIISSMGLPKAADTFLRVISSLLPDPHVPYSFGSAVSPRGSIVGLYPRRASADIGGSTSLYKFFENMLRTVHAREGQFLPSLDKGPWVKLGISPAYVADLPVNWKLKGGTVDPAGLFSQTGPLTVGPADSAWSKAIMDVLGSTYYRIAR